MKWPGRLQGPGANCRHRGYVRRASDPSTAGYVWKEPDLKTGGVDGSFCQEMMDLTACGKLDAGFLITHRCRLDQILEAYDVFEQKKDHVIKYAIKP